jgi:hypothetical protein
MKNFYIAVQCCQDGKYYAFMVQVSEDENLFAKLSGISGIVAANICPTCKRCREIVQSWRDMFRRSGCYMFEKPQF